MDRRIYTIATLSLVLATASAHAEADKMQPAKYQLDQSSALIEQRKAALTMNKRTYDPFGKNKDPNARPAPIAKVENKPKETAVKEKPPEMLLKDQIDKLKPKINASGNNIVIINGRKYSRGNILTLEAKDEQTKRTKQFKVKLEVATSSMLAFRNMESDQLHYLQLGSDLLQNSGNAPELPDTNPDEPIQLDDKQSRGR